MDILRTLTPFYLHAMFFLLKIILRVNYSVDLREKFVQFNGLYETLSFKIRNKDRYNILPVTAPALHVLCKNLSL